MDKSCSGISVRLKVFSNYWKSSALQLELDVEAEEEALSVCEALLL